jgi:hypothetical protein
MSKPSPSAETESVGSGSKLEPVTPACRARGGWFSWSLAVPAAVLVASVGVQGIHVFQQTHRGLPPHLARALPTDLPGWTARELPLGPNEFLSGEVEKVLNFDDVVYREFRRGDESFEVYVAYWGAGKMPTRMVASHTPDRCWTENGWQCVAMRFKQPETLDNSPLQPAEWREFVPPTGGRPIYVMYWHLVEGHLYDYGSRFNAVPDPVLWWKDAVQQAFLGSREQYFIRINSDEPLEDLWNDPGFTDVLRSLAGLGLSQSQTKG